MRFYVGLERYSKGYFVPLRECGKELNLPEELINFDGTYIGKRTGGISNFKEYVRNEKRIPKKFIECVKKYYTVKSIEPNIIVIEEKLTPNKRLGFRFSYRIDSGSLY